MSFEEDLGLFKVLEQFFLHIIFWLVGMAYNMNASSQTFWHNMFWNPKN
jgi:hypothetical protein